MAVDRAFRHLARNGIVSHDQEHLAKRIVLGREAGERRLQLRLVPGGRQGQREAAIRVQVIVGGPIERAIGERGRLAPEQGQRPDQDHPRHRRREDGKAGVEQVDERGVLDRDDREGGGRGGSGGRGEGGRHEGHKRKQIQGPRASS